MSPGAGGFTGGLDDDRIIELLKILPLACPNVLLIGLDSELALVFQRMQPYLRTVIVPWMLDFSSDAGLAASGTVLVSDVSCLDAGQQARLARIADVPDVQIISMARRPVFPLIETGEFLDKLYYRLNTVTLDLTARGQAT